MPIEVLEIDEERPVKDKPPQIVQINPGTSGRIVVEKLGPYGSFSIFGRKKACPPRHVMVMSVVDRLDISGNLLGSGQREERKLLPLCSDHPEEAARYWSYARLARGKTLVRGAGVGLFQQMLPKAKLVVSEESRDAASLLVENSFRDKAGELSRFFLIISSIHEVISKSKDKYDFIFVDDIPRLKRSHDHLMYTNELIGKLKRICSHSGKIAIRGYREMVIGFQKRCQEMTVGISKDIFGAYSFPGRLGMMERMFLDWAILNKKRVIERRDFKFVNAWARKTALTVV